MSLTTLPLQCNFLDRYTNSTERPSLMPQIRDISTTPTFALFSRSCIMMPTSFHCLLKSNLKMLSQMAWMALMLKRSSMTLIDNCSNRLISRLMEEMESMSLIRWTRLSHITKDGRMSSWLTVSRCLWAGFDGLRTTTKEEKILTSTCHSTSWESIQDSFTIAISSTTRTVEWWDHTCSSFLKMQSWTPKLPATTLPTILGPLKSNA